MAFSDSRSKQEFRMDNSRRMFERASKTLAGGVGGGGRGHLFGFTPHPIFIDRGEGAYLFDVDGNSYIDYLAAWGPPRPCH